MAKNPVNIKKGKITQKSHFGAGGFFVNFFPPLEIKSASLKKVYVVEKPGFFVSNIYQTTRKNLGTSKAEKLLLCPLKIKKNIKKIKIKKVKN